MNTILSKLILFCALLVIGIQAEAANYYFSNEIGDDSRSASQAQNPNTPWKSINKLNAIFSSLKPGDAVHFRRGETYYGTIRINASGSSGNPITIGAYGSGSAPIITSLTRLNNWQSLGNGVYETSNSSLQNREVNIVLVNDKFQEMGRYPNSDAPERGYLTYESVGNQAIIDNDLSSSPNWTGGEVVIRKIFWITDRHRITSHSGTRINYASNSSSSYQPRAGYGYFIQNHPSTLDKFGEWYYNPSNKRFRIYSGSSSPANHSVQVATLDHLVTNNRTANGITFKDLHFKGSNKNAINIQYGRDVKILNCKVEYSGLNAIDVEGVSNLQIEGNQIYHTNNTAFRIRSSNGAILKSNTIDYTYMYPGHGQSGDGTGVAMLTNGHDNLIEYNRILNTGYIGINFGGNNTVVKNNLIDGFCLTKNDGGGIYSYSGRNLKGRKVIGNIVLNGQGVIEGTNFRNYLSRPQAEGIYLDDDVNDVDVADNTIAHMTSKGIYLHNTNNIRLRNNTVFDSRTLLFLRNDNMGGQLANTTIENNNFILKDAFQYHVHKATLFDDLLTLASSNRNYYASPFFDNVRYSTKKFMGTSREESHFFNLPGWQSIIGNDRSSSEHKNIMDPYTVKETKGENRYDNSKFDRNVNGVGCNDCNASWDNSGKLDGPSLRVKANGRNSGDSRASFVVRSLSKGKNYVLKFSAVSNKPIPISSYIRENSSPWQTVTYDRNFTITPTRQEFEIVYTPVADVDVARIMMLIGDTNNADFWIDNFEFYEADVEFKPLEDIILFEYNASTQSKSINLRGEYVDSKNKPYSGSVTLEPYTSIILFKTSETTASSSSSTPKIAIVSPTSSSHLTSGKDIEIKTETSINNGSISKVEFFNGNNLIGSSDSEPYNFVWKNVPAGNYELKARATSSNSQQASSEVVKLSVSTGTSSGSQSENSYYLNTGTNQKTSLSGAQFQGDENLGTIFNSNLTNSNRQASDIELFQTERYGRNLKYRIPIKNGSYKVTTLHNELWFGKGGPAARSGNRIFDIVIQGKTVKNNLDLFQESNNEPLILTFDEIEVKNGYLEIEMNSSRDNATVSGIIIDSKDAPLPNGLTALSGNKGGIFLNTGSESTVNYDNQSFKGDVNHSYHGTSITNFNRTTTSRELYQTERYASRLSYTIPVENGIYTVKTYHNELWFGSFGPSAKANNRVFDILIEGKTVKQNFDIFRENNNKPTVNTFTDIVVNDGVLNIDMIAAQNNATISGLAIIPQGNSGTANLRVMEEGGLDQSSDQQQGVAHKPTAKLYPNPASSQVNLSLGHDYRIKDIVIHSTNGQLIKRIDPNTALDGGIFNISLEGIKAGIYVISIYDGSDFYEKHKLIIRD